MLGLTLTRLMLISREVHAFAKITFQSWKGFGLASIKMSSYTNGADGLPDNATDLKTATPWTVRELIRQGKYGGRETAGVCQGYVQANMVMIPSKYSDDFRQFCAANFGPMPLLFASKKGQFDAPPLTANHPSDIRSDVPLYNVIENGVLTRKVDSLTEFGDKMNDFCFFYLGCSFSFDKLLLSAGVPLRNLDNKGRGKNVSMYRTNVKCYKSGVVDCYQVVSMKPIPADAVQRAYEVTHPLTTVHGAPIHIGDPAAIGIRDIKKVDYGDPSNMEQGDVPVFWSCGVTGLEAVKSLNIPLAFTHAPGNMFITDLPSTEDSSDPITSPLDRPRVIFLSEETHLASALSETAQDSLEKLEAACLEDPGKRGIASLVVSGDLMKSALSLSHASRVAIITGFPLLRDSHIPFETDGPPGALALAVFLQSLGKEVTLILNKGHGLDEVMKSVMESLTKKGVLQESPNVEIYPPSKSQNSDLETAIAFLTTDGDVCKPRFDHIVSIEYPGKASDGHYYTMWAGKVTEIVTGMDVLFEAGKKIPGTFTTGIGDGGNELGMGKVHNQVKRNVTNGATIASSVAADFIITCGVSNWGGYALCCALYILRCDPIHDRYRRRGLGFPVTDKEKEKLRQSLPDEKREEAVLRALLDHEFEDMNGKGIMAVDGLDFYQIHVPKLKQLLGCINF